MVVLGRRRDAPGNEKGDPLDKKEVAIVRVLIVLGVPFVLLLAGLFFLVHVLQGASLLGG